MITSPADCRLGVSRGSHSEIIRSDLSKGNGLWAAYSKADSIMRWQDSKCFTNMMQYLLLKGAMTFWRGQVPGIQPGT